MTAHPDDPSAAERAAQRRAFIRATHPDAGGDPERFIEGLARFDAAHRAPGGSSPAAGERPSVHRSRRPDRVVRQALRQLRRRLAGLPPRTLR